MSNPTFMVPLENEAANSTAGWQCLGRLLEYPGADFAARLTEAARMMPGWSVAVRQAWERFSSAVGRMSPDEREELYTATFDLCPACVPYVGIHLFGEENYRRGRFMAALLERYAEEGFATGGELPDHLAVLLRFAAQTEDAEQRELTQFCLLGPLRRMQESLAEEHPYRALLEMVEEALKETHPGVAPAPCPLAGVKEVSAGGCGCSASFLAGIQGGGGNGKEEL
ncbi:nitrate reductase molybdenum cofactor assembly chaperone [Fontisphaera persica]|uniref:nitrate reductase molybdenum cofactor assembly chaperone n=1 Tax=Fontisphaera persica TaxID=2974023 RepID=UPI0024C032F0|nr:nitrate reductase molybdenum cofactor assembly chaperone [Fontisphaera persica]WCJ60117.1 nitrate reductase molybdenum cofactor assembly chaperone [Fontisphaera persica]